MQFKLKTEKGGNFLSNSLQSISSRWYKLLFFGGICLAMFVISFDSGENFSNMPPSTNNSLRNGRKLKRNPSLRPPEQRPDREEWHSLTRHEMNKQYLKCDYEVERAIHDPDTWMGMREAYISVVGTEKATVELDDAWTFETAFRVPFEVRQSPGMGRGIFALQDVSKGDRLYDFSQSAQFSRDSEFKEFLRIIQPELACDVLMWSYVQYFGEGILSYSSNALYESQKPFLRIVTDLDPGSFCNSGGASKGNMAWLNAEGNIAVGDLGDGTTDNPPHPPIQRTNGVVEKTVKSAPLVALRDIKEGEELLCVYSQFSEGLGQMIK